MKDLNYKPKAYRLSKETIDNLKEISHKEKLSYNLLFVKFINNYNKKYDRNKVQSTN